MSVFLYLVLSLMLIVIIKFIYKKTPIYDDRVFLLTAFFVFISLFLGRGVSFYSFIPHYDKILHFISGIISAYAGRVIFVKLGGDTKNKMLWRFFTLSIAFSVASLWEIWEFSADGILGTTSQNASLTDTMADIISASLSALLFVFIKALF